MISGLTLGMLKASVADSWRERETEDLETFLPDNVRFPEGWETTEFDFDETPYVRGIIKRFVNDPTKRKANLRFASRLGKTTTGISLLIGQVKNDPCPAAILFPDEDTLNNTLDGQIYPILEATTFTARQIPKPEKRNRIAIRFNEMRVRLATGGKKSSVSGYASRWILKVEVNKNPTRKSTEGDPVERIDSRANGFDFGVKILQEGTPTNKATCRSEYFTNSPDVQRLEHWVPCPHCKTYQTLVFEQLCWDKDTNGRSTKEQAVATAHYKCQHCEKKIEDSHRTAMIQAGVWLAEGETIDKRGRVRGAPKVNGDTQNWALSCLYSLMIDGWGFIVGLFIDATAEARLGKFGKLRTFWNEVLSLCWDPAQRKTKAHKVAQRLRCDDHMTIQTLPKWTSFCTLTSDVGKIGEQLVFYYMLIAWGAPFTMPRGAIVDWGITEDKGEFLKEWKGLAYPIDGTETVVKMWGQPSTLDSGDFTQEIYDLCRPIKNCWPLKGDSRTNVTDWYKLGYARAGCTPRQVANKKKMGRPDLFEPSSDVTQGWRQALVEGRITSGDVGFVSLPDDVCEGWEEFADFMDELTCDQLVDGKWEGDDNEFGDTLRYGMSLAHCYVDGRYRGRWEALPLIQAASNQGTSGLYNRRSRGEASEPFVKGF